MSTVNRILLARGPNGSNLDKLFDVKANDGAQNEVILKKEWFDMHSNKYTLGFMTIVAVILGSFLSIAAGSLKEIQE